MMGTKVLMNTFLRNIACFAKIVLCAKAKLELSKGNTTGRICRILDISEQTYYCWRKEYGNF